MSFCFDGKVVVVTGGASGIGQATAVAFAEAGARVMVGDVRATADPDVFDKLGIVELRCDVRCEDEVRQLVTQAAAPGERVDVLVNNAGVGMIKQIDEVTEEEWDRCLDTNLKGAFFGCKHVIPRMRPQGGAIVNVASNAGLLPRAHDPVYSISKHALVGLTKSLALCHSKDKIRVNAVCPGPVGGTDLMNEELDLAPDRELAEQRIINASPLARAHARMISSAEIAQSILYLASDAAAMVTGTSVAIDGGKSLGVPPA
ncbi:MAG TPA: hypothetical protein DCY79_15710 [Planctomycetaceae bacterium]|nr:hypothetical protein [Blastopirellula sp.]HAY81250.1 hypothetical protein [Planctomycetaceae bacterium]